MIFHIYCCMLNYNNVTAHTGDWNLLWYDVVINDVGVREVHVTSDTDTAQYPVIIGQLVETAGS
jgi:hypothetical protein